MNTTTFLVISAWTWGSYFKWTGIVYGLYYAANITYDLSRYFMKRSKTAKNENGEITYELNFEQNKSPNTGQNAGDKKDGFETIAPQIVVWNETPPETEMFEPLATPSVKEPFSNEIVEQYSENAKEFIEGHQRNVAKAALAF